MALRHDSRDAFTQAFYLDTDIPHLPRSYSTPEMPWRSPKYTVVDNDEELSLPSTIKYLRNLQFTETVQTSVPLTTFHKFPDLPLELRRKIWKFALPDPRVVCFELHDNVVRKECYIKLSSHRHLIGLEQELTCKERREVFLSNYLRIGLSNLWTEYNPQRPLASTIQRIDGKRDTLVISFADIQMLESIGLWLDLSSIRYLGLQGGFHYGPEGLDLFVGAFAKAICPKLKELTIMLGHIHWLTMPHGKDELCLLDVDRELLDAEVDTDEVFMDFEIEYAVLFAREARAYFINQVQIASALRGFLRMHARQDPDRLKDIVFKVALLCTKNRKFVGDDYADFLAIIDLGGSKLFYKDDGTFQSVYDGIKELLE